MSLPEILQGLPDIPAVLRTSGQFCAELFCGDAAITLALVFENLPCICPWDRAYGVAFDVAEHDNVFFALAEEGRLMLVHLGIPCQSLTWARWPAIRSWEAIWGIPGVGAADVEKFLTGNKLLLFAVQLCIKLHVCWLLVLS